MSMSGLVCCNNHRKGHIESITFDNVGMRNCKTILVWDVNKLMRVYLSAKV